jgi:hypothetical protein
VRRGVENPQLFSKFERLENLIDELDTMLNCRFSLLLRNSPLPSGNQV